MDFQKEKEAFEAWFESRYDAHFMQFALDLDLYVDKHTQTCWEAWQAKAQAVPEWISVEDKLPTENGNYLVCIDGDVFYLTAKWVKNHFKFLARGYGLTEDFTDWRYCEGVKVTHWMTLPAAPQEPTND